MSEPIAAEGADETTAVSSDAVTLSLDGAPAAAPSEGGKRRFTGRKRPERQSTNEDPRTPAERRIVFVANLLLNLCGVVLWAGMLTVNALYDGIISTTGWELSQVSLLFTLQIFTCFLFCPLWGVAASYVSIRKLLAGAVLAGAFLNILTGLVYLTDSFICFCILQVLKGIFLSPCQCLNRALIPKYYRLAERGKYYGLLEVSAGVGGLLGVVFGAASFVGPNGAEGYFGCPEVVTNETLCPGDPGFNVTDSKYDFCDDSIPKWTVPFFILGGFMIPCAFLVWKVPLSPMHPRARDTLSRQLGTASALFMAIPQRAASQPLPSSPGPPRPAPPHASRAPCRLVSILPPSRHCLSSFRSLLVCCRPYQGRGRQREARRGAAQGSLSRASR